jgi:hypothetical protein
MFAAASRFNQIGNVSEIAGRADMVFSLDEFSQLPYGFGSDIVALFA